MSSIRLFAIIGGMIFLGASCEFTTEEDLTRTYYDEDELSLTEYIYSNDDQFSTLTDILDTTGLGHLFKAYGDYTFLAPVDSAFELFFAEKGKSSYKDFTVSELTELIKYHIFNMRIMAGAFNMGIIESKTLTMDYMISSLSSDGSDVILNKSSKMLLRDVILPNGILHSVDRVIEKPTMSIYEWLSTEDNYSIFVEALDQTGVADIAKGIVEESEGGSEFYTCFVIPNEVYAESNINSFSELASMISPDDNNYDDEENALRLFVMSHFTGNLISISDATEEHVYYGALGGATMKYGLIPNTAEVSLNYNTPDFPEGLGIDEFGSNNLTANGIVHIMDTLYLVTKTFERITRSFVFCDVPGLPYDSLYNYGITLWEEKGIYCRETGNGVVGSENQVLGQWSQFWPRPGDGDHLPFENFDGWLTLNAPYSGEIKTDHHMNSEYNPLFFTYSKCDDLLDVTRKFPYIIPGKYRLLHLVKPGYERPSIKHYFDGEPIGGIINMAQNSLSFEYLDLGIVEIEEGEQEHFLRIQCLTVGKGFYIEVVFEPVN